jgi:hypothetical protein
VLLIWGSRRHITPVVDGNQHFLGLRMFLKTFIRRRFFFKWIRQRDCGIRSANDYFSERWLAAIFENENKTTLR